MARYSSGLIGLMGAIGQMVACAAAVLVAAGAEAAFAQQVQAPKKPATNDKAKEVAQKAYADGVRAYERGKLDSAMKNITTALARGGLPNSQMAKALYIRGQVYRKRKKPAQAVSDLTTALWLKGGLNETDRKKAEASRAAAYREVGLSDPPPIAFLPPQAARKNAAGPTTPAAPTMPRPTPGAKVARAKPNSIWSYIPEAPSLGSALPSFGNPFGSSSEKKAEAKTPPAGTAAAGAAPGNAPAAGTAAGPPALTPPQAGQGVAAAPTTAANKSAQQFFNWETSTAPAASPPVGAPQTTAAVPQAASGTPGGVAVTAPQPSYQPAPTQTVQAPAAQTSSGGGLSSITNYLGNLFSGGSVAPTTTTPKVPAASSASSWETATNKDGQIIAVNTPQRPPVRREIPVSAGEGIYKLQVAVSHSREEAMKIAQAIETDPAVQRVGLKPQVDQASYGNMGSFYRVRIGPFANALSPNEVCKGLRPKGYDCAVVTR